MSLACPECDEPRRPGETVCGKCGAVLPPIEKWEYEDE